MRAPRRLRSQQEGNSLLFPESRLHQLPACLLTSLKSTFPPRNSVQNPIATVFFPSLNKQSIMYNNYILWVETSSDQIQTLGYLTITAAVQQLKISHAPADMPYPKKGVFFLFKRMIPEGRDVWLLCRDAACPPWLQFLCRGKTRLNSTCWADSPPQVFLARNLISAAS